MAKRKITQKDKRAALRKPLVLTGDDESLLDVWPDRRSKLYVTWTNARWPNNRVPIVIGDNVPESGMLALTQVWFALGQI